MTSENISQTATAPATQATAVDTAVAKYLPYLKEIQKKLTILLIVILVSGISGFLFYQKILTFAMRIFNLEGITVVLSSPYQFIELAINTGIATGVIVAFPLLIYYLLGFLKPALAPKEYKTLTRLVPLALLLFIIGFSFGGWLMQSIINLFYKTAVDFNIANIWDISRFFSQTIIMGVCLGLLFEMPVVITLLIRLKILSKSAFQKNRTYIYVGLLILAAFMPPADVISLAILTLIPLFLFEIALLFN